MLERTQVSDVAQIYALWNEYTAAWSAGDMARWIALWIDGGIQMPPGVPHNTGKEQIQAAMQRLLDTYDYEMTINPEEVRVLGDRAYSHGHRRLAMTPKSGGDSAEVRGKFLTVLEKQVDGSWKIAIDCFNYDAPLR
jgi:uncharacterized protein (TIGR02246 family)